MGGTAVLVTTSSGTVRVRYSVAGLSFSGATLHVQARSYSTGSSTDVRAWSPLYGATTFGPVDNDFTYDWYAADWSASLSPSDDPLLTAIELNASGGSGQLALREVELCLEP